MANSQAPEAVGVSLRGSLGALLLLVGAVALFYILTRKPAQAAPPQPVQVITVPQQQETWQVVWQDGLPVTVTTNPTPVPAAQLQYRIVESQEGPALSRLL